MIKTHSRQNRNPHSTILLQAFGHQAVFLKQPRKPPSSIKPSPSSPNDKRQASHEPYRRGCKRTVCKRMVYKWTVYKRSVYKRTVCQRTVYKRTVCKRTVCEQVVTEALEMVKTHYRQPSDIKPPEKGSPVTEEEVRLPPKHKKKYLRMLVYLVIYDSG